MSGIDFKSLRNAFEVKGYDQLEIYALSGKSKKMDVSDNRVDAVNLE